MIFFFKLWYSFINYWRFLCNWMDVHDIAFKKSFQYLFYKQFQLLHSINIKEDNSFCFVVVHVVECVLFYFGFFFVKTFNTCTIELKLKANLQAAHYITVFTHASLQVVRMNYGELLLKTVVCYSSYLYLWFC